jgi:hypothetical protein
MEEPPMKKALLWVVAVFMLAASFMIFADTSHAAYPHVPVPTFHFDPVVNVPDPKLNTALHTLTGVPAAEKLHKSDLTALTGNVAIENKGIADAEGIQYCTNITYLSLLKNPLTNIPSMTGMAKLETLRLSRCGLTEWPAGKLPPKLKTLDLSNNDISEFPEPFTDPCGTWRTLDLSNNDISEFPSWMTDLALESLYLNRNDISELPESVDDMTNLKQLSIAGNKLQSIPDSICSMANLTLLNVSDNELYSLPENIGAHLDMLSARNNRLESLPGSIGSSTSLYGLDVMLNRLTRLPSNLDDHDYDYINVEFNFIDMSPGSADRKRIEDTNSMEKYYERQLKRITGLTATPASDSVTLTWQPGESGSGGGATWEVTGYVVYLYDGGMNKLSDVDVDLQTYTHTGLMPETAYQYRVGVNYHVEYPAMEIDDDIRAYTRAEATTLSAAAEVSETAAAQSTAAASEAVTVSAAPSPQADEVTAATAVSQGPGSDADTAGLPAWAIIVIGILGVAVVGTGVTLWLMKLGVIKTAKGAGGGPESQQ